MLLLALAITALAAPALAYKATLESRTDEFAAESSDAAG